MLRRSSISAVLPRHYSPRRRCGWRCGPTRPRAEIPRLRGAECHRFCLNHLAEISAILTGNDMSSRGHRTARTRSISHMAKVIQPLVAL